MQSKTDVTWTALLTEVNAGTLSQQPSHDGVISSKHLFSYVDRRILHRIACRRPPRGI